MGGLVSNGDSLRCFFNVLSGSRDRFNKSWFTFHNSSSSFHEPYFSRKHIFIDSEQTQEYGLKTYK